MYELLLDFCNWARLEQCGVLNPWPSPSDSFRNFFVVFTPQMLLAEEKTRQTNSKNNILFRILFQFLLQWSRLQSFWLLSSTFNVNAHFYFEFQQQWDHFMVLLTCFICTWLQMWMKLAQEPQMSLRRNPLPVRWQAKVQIFVCCYTAAWKLREWWRWSSSGENQQSSFKFNSLHCLFWDSCIAKWVHTFCVCFFFSRRPEWYGMLYSQADSKKKSNLMMSLFEPSAEPLPWLGKISHLGPISGNLWQTCWTTASSFHIYNKCLESLALFTKSNESIISRLFKDICGLFWNSG